MIQEQHAKVVTADGIELGVLKYLPKQARGQIFMLHWLSVPKEWPSNILRELALWLADHWFKVVTFDFRGHGTSGGESVDITVETGFLDFDTVFTTEVEDGLPLGIFWFSYGGLVAIEYTVQHSLSPQAMVFFSPALDFVKGVFENKSSVMGTLYQEAEANGSLDRNGYFVLPYNGFKVGKNVFVSAGKYKPYEDLPKITTHSLIIQGKNDQMLSYEYMKQLGEPIVEKYLVLDTVHWLVEEKEKAIAETVQWFSKYVQ